MVLGLPDRQSGRGPRRFDLASEKQREANRKNAQHSTGPRTEHGKKKSSSNSLKHGGWATSSVAVPRGRFKENPDEIDAFVTAIVDALHPRDALEVVEANNIAVLYLRLRRIARYECESIAGHSAERSIYDSFTSKGLSSDREEQVEYSAFNILEMVLYVSTRVEGATAKSLNMAAQRYQHLAGREIPTQATDRETNPIPAGPEEAEGPDV